MGKAIPSEHSNAPFTLESDALPAPETAWRRTVVRSTALGTCVLTLVYLIWRVGWSLTGGSLWLGLALVAVEAHNATGLALFTFSLWDVDAPTPPARVEATDLRLAMLIPTYNEPLEVLLPTVSAAVAIEPAHETWVLDDGGRPEVAAMAERLGARYLTRPDRSHAKAGNLNNSLSVIEADVVGVVDADHVVGADFFRRTLGYFDDPELAVVQTPQSFYNHDSFEHAGSSERSYSEQTIFYRLILPAKNRWNAGFWCGTCALLRTEALREVGGVATESVTEDIQTTIRLQRAGWRTVVHNEVLARGLAAADASQYWLQRHRWSQGAMQVLRKERLLTGRGLTLAQRLAYSATLFAWFDAWRLLAYFVIPVIVAFTGAMPVGASLAVFGPAFFTVLTAQFVAMRLLARGHYPPFWSLVFEALRLPAVLPATLSGLRGRPTSFKVTPKGRVDGDRHVPQGSWLHKVLLGATAVTVAWVGATLAGVTPTHYSHPWGVLGSVAFLLLNASVVVVAMLRVRSERFAGERRTSVRFSVEAPASFGGAEGSLLDISLTGARLDLPASVAVPAVGSEVTVAVSGWGFGLRAEVVRALPSPESTVVMVRFLPDQQIAIAQLALAIFQGRDGLPSDRSAEFDLAV